MPRERLGGRSPARLSIGLRHTIGAAAKYSQFCEILMLAAATLCVVVSEIYSILVRGSRMVRCVQCGTDLVAPARSEYWSDNHACHIWHCPKCCACFSSIISFSEDTDTETMRRHNFRLCATTPAAWRYWPHLIFAEQFCRRSPPRFTLSFLLNCGPRERPENTPRPIFYA